MPKKIPQVEEFLDDLWATDEDKEAIEKIKEFVHRHVQAALHTAYNNINGQVNVLGWLDKRTVTGCYPKSKIK